MPFSGSVTCSIHLGIVAVLYPKLYYLLNKVRQHNSDNNDDDDISLLLVVSVNEKLRNQKLSFIGTSDMHSQAV